MPLNTSNPKSVAADMHLGLHARMLLASGYRTHVCLCLNLVYGAAAGVHGWGGNRQTKDKWCHGNSGVCQKENGHHCTHLQIHVHSPALLLRRALEQKLELLRVVHLHNDDGMASFLK